MTERDGKRSSAEKPKTAEEASAAAEVGQLVDRAKRGERGAFARLYAQFRPPVFGYFRARVLNGEDAEDMCQEVFLRVFNAIGRYLPGTPFQAWLMGISRNVLREHIRRIKRRRETGWTELCVELEEMVDQDSLYEDVIHLVPGCMATLSEPAAHALHSHYMGGHKVQAIADGMGRTLGAVKVLMVRARQALKRCIKRQMEERGETLAE